MDIASYVLLGQEQALKRRMDIVANNIANSSTVGFKRERPVFHDKVVDAGSDIAPQADTTKFVLDFHAVHDMSAGAFQATGNPLDVMIDGPGYLAVETPDGTAYTRAGFLRVDDKGFLVTGAGDRVQGEGGAAIAIPAESQATLTIAADGTVSAKDGPLGRLALTRFPDETGLDPIGDGLFRGASGEPVPASETKIRSGGVEGSNVEPIVETTAMIDILRSYQSSVRMSESIADLRNRAIDRLGRIG